MKRRSTFVLYPPPPGISSHTFSQGTDADDFNPDRFIDSDGQVTPALANTKDGASVLRPDILIFAYSLASQLQKVIIFYTHCNFGTKLTVETLHTQDTYHS